MLLRGFLALAERLEEYMNWNPDLRKAEKTCHGCALNGTPSGVGENFASPAQSAHLPFLPAVIFVAITSCKQTWSKGQEVGSVYPSRCSGAKGSDCKCVHSKKTRPCRGGQTSALEKEGVDNAGMQRRANPGFKKDREASYPHRIQSLYHSSLWGTERDLEQGNWKSSALL